MSHVNHIAKQSSLFTAINLPPLLNLEKAVGSEQLAQLFDSSSYTKKVLITIKVTTHFFVTLSKSNTCTIYLPATAFSRLKRLNPG